MSLEFGGHYPRAKALGMGAVIFFVFALVAACGSGGSDSTATPSAANDDLNTPSATVPGTATIPDASPPPGSPEATVKLVKGDPKALVLQRGDLPAGFAEPIGEYRGANVYNVAYLRLQALTGSDPSRTNLVAAVTSVGIYESPEAARQQFEAQGGLDRDAVEKELKASTSTATDIIVDVNDVALEGTDRVVSFRIAYTAGETRVVGYRYSFIVSNTVATVSIISRVISYAQEPPDLRSVTREITLRQVRYLLGALG